MSNGLEKLKSIGAQKIHEDTHIARHYAQAVLQEIFDEMTKIQFLGFISILEREYSVDLSDLKAKGEELYSGDSTKIEEDIIHTTASSSQESKNNTSIYIAIVVIIFAVAVYFTLSLDASKSNGSDKIDDSAIENAKDSMSNNATIVEDEKIVKPVAVLPKSFKVITETQLWMGYMDIDTYEKKQKLFIGELELDAGKNWLISLGHGYVKVEIDGKVTEFKSRRNLKLLYKDLKLKKIKFNKFVEINGGREW